MRPRHKITPAAISAFKDMQAARYGSKAWWRAHHALHDALRLPPWIFPFDGSEDNRPIYPMIGGVSPSELWHQLADKSHEPDRHLT
jgi:hypothetical protein